MDELEFRRQIMSNPKARDQDILDALSENESNSKFADDIMELDKKIAQAMNVDVPDDLADRILFNQTAGQSNNVVKANFTKRALSLAASVAFTAGLLIGQVNWGNIIVQPAQASLANTALSHVFAEKTFIMGLDEQVSSQQINVKMTPFAYKFTETFPYHVYYLNHCGFGDSNAMHMVFAGEVGRVTMFVTNVFSDKEVSFDKQGMVGVVAPIGNTSMILVGEQGEDVAKIAEQLSHIIKPAA
ncbi:DUF3379 family protein [Vibrio mexicanus]|uniref:DUF3379 family protein n=1 Tax=Vibrio mexicanus TaxID=1004326 RepID=UPI00063C4705|nr:DUF3379 family protein [Vibrio mexicanus]